MEENQTIKKLQQLEHSCSIIALSRMFPNIEYEKLVDVFKNNTEVIGQPPPYDIMPPPEPMLPIKL